MAFGLYSLLEAALLVLNAICVLHEDRFLAKVYKFILKQRNIQTQLHAVSILQNLFEYLKSEEPEYFIFIFGKKFQFIFILKQN